MKPPLKVEHINAGIKPPPYTTNPPYYIRAAKVAFMLAKGENLKDIALVNPLIVTTFCKHSFSV